MPELKLTLIRAADDPPLRSSEYQKGLHDFADSLGTAGFKVSVTLELIEAAGGAGPATYLGDFMIELARSPLVVVIGTAVGAWLHARYGRKVRLRMGDIEAEAQTAEEVERLLARGLEIQQLSKPTLIQKP